MGGSDDQDAGQREVFAAPRRVLSRGDLLLEPYLPEHAPLLFEAMEESPFDFYPICPAEWTEPGLAEYLESLPERGFFGLTAFVQGQAVGFSCYLDIRTEHRGLEIGHTFLAERWRGSGLNPAMKRLMIGQAIEEFGAVRVQFKTDARNWASRKAMTGMGFHEEGVWRNHLVMPDGFLRDSVYFSVTPEDWPAIRDGLDAMVLARGISPREG